MAIVLTQDGRRGILGLLLPWLAGLEYHLFGNDYVPVIGSTPVDFDPPLFSGYAFKRPVNWSGAFLDDLHDAVTTAETLTWTVAASSPGVVVWGYWVRDRFGYCLYAERNPAGATPMSTIGDTFPLQPLFAAGALC